MGSILNHDRKGKFRIPAPGVRMRKSMNENTLGMVAERFRILGDPMRLRILQAIGPEERTVADLAERCATSQANASKHLGVLLRAGLVTRRKEGLFVHYRVADPSVFRMCDLVCGSIKERLAHELSQFEPPRSGERKGNR